MKPKLTKLTAGLSVLAMSFSFLAAPAVSSAQNDSQSQQIQNLQQQIFNQVNQNLQNLWKPDFQHPLTHTRVCSNTGLSFDQASCDARVVTDSSGKAKTFVAPAGYSPAQFLGAYGLNGTAAGKKIIGIVDAYDDPNIQSDLNTYSSQFGLPALPACVGAVNSSSKPCFQKVDQNGGTRYPARNSGWDLEISLDVEMAHAVCQNCSVLLVEASSSSYNNLMTSIDRAASLGANVISDSWGGSEFSGETSYDSYLSGLHGVAITFSTGDSGYGVAYPASSKYVTAVGGTTLNLNGTSYIGETAWSGAGSGCSAYESKPTWQTDTGCSKRTVADVSADADPNTGAAVYDSTPYYGEYGWFQVGGTSLASPIVAATYAQGAALSTSVAANSLPYANTNSLHDVVSGSNGSCGGSYLCTAKPGYDGPTGLGTPNSVGAF